MLKWLRILTSALRSALLTRRNLALENLALRQQLAVYKETHPRPRLTDADRRFWVLLSKTWHGWRATLHIVQPDTVVRWHRQGFRSYWRWKNRRRGRPAFDPEVIQLIRRMCRTNPLWGAPRIHGELLKLGIDICETTAAKYMIKRRGPPSQAWKTFLENHLKETIALDFFTVPTATFRVLFVLVILSHDRRRILHFNVTGHPTAVWTSRQLLQCCGFDDQPLYLIRDRDAIFGNICQRQVRALGIEDVPTAPKSPWQNPYAERVIGSIRRECLDHVIVLGEAHLRRILSNYSDYYNGARTHLALHKDSPDERPVHTLDLGAVRELAHVGGLHHQYVRMAA
jgi:transposase InsO family protein